MRVNFLISGRNTLGGVVIHILLAGLSLLVLCILYFAVYLPGITNHNQTIIVPDIEGKALQQLQTEPLFVTSTLLYQVNDSSYSSDYPALTVLKQYPPAGSKVKEGRKILLSVNQRNPPTVLVPDLIDGSVINAATVLRSSQLKPGKIEFIPGPYKIVKEMRYHGQVIAASFPVPKGSVIDLIVMDGLGDDQTDTIP
jgi:beta-lactam-binding protein with PASTA domain